MTTTTAVPHTAEVDFLGARCRVLCEGDATAGRVGLVDMIEIPAGDMAPVHVHHAQDEAFYVMSGELSLFLPGQHVALGAGQFFLAPRGVPHTYMVGGSPARVLVMSTPAGFERFVLEVAALDELSPEVLGATAAAHDIEILGPPGTMPS
jgi:quercetin dioxygenase-like cupin family protein